VQTTYQSSYFHLGWLEGWHEAFLGWLQPPHATPVEPPLASCLSCPSNMNLAAENSNLMTSSHLLALDRLPKLGGVIEGLHSPVSSFSGYQMLLFQAWVSRVTHLRNIRSFSTLRA